MPKRKKRVRQLMRPWDDFETDGYVQGQTLPSSWSQSPEAYARWLFEFLRTDLRTLTPGQLLGMRADLWAFVRPEIIEDKSWGNESLPTAEVLEAIQQDARAGIQRLREGEWFALERGIGYGIARFGDHIMRGGRRGTFEDLFRAAMIDTVQTLWERLRECPRCHAMFLKVGKQKYCSSICARRTHWDAFKERRPNRDHHTEYARRVQNRLGANVKVSRKPRRQK
jgi:hypothetical protein